MKKIVFAFILLTIAGVAKSQVANLFSGFDLTAIQAGDSFALEIRNTGAAPATFYPLTVFDSLGNYLFLSEENYFNYLKKDENQINSLRAHARIVKSPYFFVGKKPVSESINGFFQQEIADKKYAFPQWFLSSCHYECGEFAAMSASILTRAGIFAKDSTWGLNLSDYHSLGEGIVNGDTLLLDFDPEMPRFLDTLPNGAFMSALDAYYHPEYFNQQSEYRICYKNDSCRTTDKNTDDYSDFFQDTSVFTRYSNYEIEPQNMSGAWTLCAGCALTFEWKAPEYVFDANDSNTAKLVDSLMAILGNHPMDTTAIGAIAQEILGASTDEEAIKALNTFNFTSVDELANWRNSGSYAYNNTTVKLTIPGRINGYSEGDIQFPLAVNKITSENGLTIGGHSISPGSHVFQLWSDQGLLDGEEEITIPPDSFYHAKDISISGNNAVEIELYYNQLLYDIFTGLNVELLSENPNLAITAFPGALSGLEEQANAFKSVFPNPTQDELWVHSQGFLTNLSGETVLQVEQGFNSINMLAPGIYFYHSTETTAIQKLVKY